METDKLYTEHKTTTDLTSANLYSIELQQPLQATKRKQLCIHRKSITTVITTTKLWPVTMSDYGYLERFVDGEAASMHYVRPLQINLLFLVLHLLP